MILTEKDVSRFWSGVEILGSDDCWFWIRSAWEGYGCFRLHGSLEKAHRVAWFLVNGLIPELFEGQRALICHKCDTPSCCNPNHLFLGNDKINSQDAKIKGHKSFFELGVEERAVL